MTRTDDAHPPALEVRGLTVHYEQLCALRELSLSVGAGDVLAIIGANGAGKSTLLRTIAGLSKPTAGSVLLDGREVTGLRAEQRVGAGIALVPEGRRLFGTLTVEENLAVGGQCSRRGAWDRQRVFDLFPWMRERRRQKASQLSGGEQQAVAIGRALVANPRVLLLDEVSLGLAPVVVQSIYAVLPDLLATGVTVLLVEQDVAQALRVATRVQCLLEGRTTLAGRPQDLDPKEIEAAYFGLRPSATNNGAGSGDALGAVALPAGAAAGAGAGASSGTVPSTGVGTQVREVTWVNTIIGGVLTGGLYALFACGLSLLFGVMKVINLAHGDFAVIAGYIAITLVPVLHVPQLWSFVVVVPIFAVGGYVLQRTLFQASIDRGAFTTLLVTFGLSVLIENVLLLQFSADSHSLNVGSFVSGSFQLGSQVFIPYLTLAIFVVAVVVLSSLQIFLSRSQTGRLIRAVADDREAAQLSGVNYRHVFGIVAAIAFATVALAGLALGMYSQFDPSAGTANLLFVFEAVVIGGLGSLWGTLVGGIVLGVAQAIGAQINPADQVLAGNLVFLAVLAVRPQGLFGSRSFG